MASTRVIFGLETGCYDSVANSDTGKEVVLATPVLSVFFSERNAVANNEGLNIVEGDLRFFAFDGSPLEAHFSEKPYVDTDRNKYFPGVYSLQSASGENLQNVLAERIARNLSPHTRIVVHMPATNESAQSYGWPDIKAMKEGIEQALKILPSDMTKRIMLEEVTRG